MKSNFGCKLQGAHQALTGIQNGVVLLHSVVGCNFGTLSFHVVSGDMSDIRQTCTVISDSDVVFSGETSLYNALEHVRELYQPAVVFVISGCVSDMIQDDVASVVRRFSQGTGLKVIPVEAAGYRGTFHDGFEQATLALLDLMEPQAPCSIPSVNLLGFGADDPRLKADLRALQELLNGKVTIQSAPACCTVADLRQAPAAGLNLVFGRGLSLAQAMEQQFGIPYAVLDYPCGLTGAKSLWEPLEKHFSLDFSEEKHAFVAETGLNAKSVYSYLQGLYGMPAAIVATTARARGIGSFLSRELGLEMEHVVIREDCRNAEFVHDLLRNSAAALLLGSSFEQEIADELKLPLLRCDYPVFDRVCLTDRPYIGPKGTLCLIEDLLNEVMQARDQKGALYQ